MKETKTLIVTETLRYEFTVPAAMHETEETLKRFFARHPGPWSEADFAAVTEREFEVCDLRTGRGRITTPPKTPRDSER
jgi:hypothetical protein